MDLCWLEHFCSDDLRNTQLSLTSCCGTYGITLILQTVAKFDWQISDMCSIEKTMSKCKKRQCAVTYHFRYIRVQNNVPNYGSHLVIILLDLRLKISAIAIQDFISLANMFIIVLTSYVPNQLLFRQFSCLPMMTLYLHIFYSACISKTVRLWNCFLTF